MQRSAVIRRAWRKLFELLVPLQVRGRRARGLGRRGGARARLHRGRRRGARERCEESLTTLIQLLSLYAAFIQLSLYTVFIQLLSPYTAFIQLLSLYQI